MFDNPEKLFIILIIALFIFGPQKLIGLGSAMGRAVRDFRGAVRDAHDQFSAAVEEAQRTAEDAYASVPPALPAPDPLPEIPMSVDAPALSEFAPTPSIPTASAPEATPEATPEAPSVVPAAADASADLEGPDSLASEPSSHAVLESLQESLRRKA